MTGPLWMLASIRRAWSVRHVRTVVPHLDSHSPGHVFSVEQRARSLVDDIGDLLLTGHPVLGGQAPSCVGPL